MSKSFYMYKYRYNCRYPICEDQNNGYRNNGWIFILCLFIQRFDIFRYYSIILCTKSSVLQAPGNVIHNYVYIYMRIYYLILIQKVRHFNIFRLNFLNFESPLICIVFLIERLILSHICIYIYVYIYINTYI
jgi:hypothetical protein